METKKQLIQKMKDELVAYALPRRSLESCSKDYLQTMYDSAVKLKLTKKDKEAQKSASIKCSICKKEIEVKGTWTQGNNAQPINNGRCCDVCNDTKVIPARIKAMSK